MKNEKKPIGEVKKPVDNVKVPTDDVIKSAIDKKNKMIQNNQIVRK